jgi:3-hydroxyisobutyrate dehydrogenase-like beta-hydroxyacid dehydrogenase
MKMDEKLAKVKEFLNNRHHILLASDYHALVDMADYAKETVREYAEKVAAHCGSTVDSHLALAPVFREMFGESIDREGE